MDYREVFNRGIQLHPNKEAIVDGKRRFTWKQWGDRQHRLANALLGLGLKKGDRLGLLLKNCAEYFDAYAAGAKTGIVIVPINFRLNPDAIRSILEEADCRALMVDAEFMAAIKAQRPLLTGLECVITVGDTESGLIGYEGLLESASSVEPQAVHSDDDLAVVFYTSGTTGAPKGSMATRRIMMARFNVIIMEMGIVPEDCYLNAMPIFHIAVIESLGTILRCATNVILRDFVPEDFCRVVEQEKISKTFLTPAVINFVLNCPKFAEYDLGSLNTILYGAAPMPMDTLVRMAKMMPQCGLIQGYGSTECFALVYLSAAEHKAALAGTGGESRKLAAAGRQAVFSMAKVVRDDGTTVSPGEVGEILLKGGAIMSGYLNKPKETAEAMRDGWFYTKDLATVDEEGYIYIVDRKNHMIITGGENVYPAQVENVLFDHPKVAEAAVIGVPDCTWGEAVKALIVLKPGERMTEKEAIEFCAPRMATYAKPRSVEFVEALPHTATGKIDKLFLKKKYWNGKEKMIS